MRWDLGLRQLRGIYAASLVFAVGCSDGGGSPGGVGGTSAAGRGGRESVAGTAGHGMSGAGRSGGSARGGNSAHGGAAAAAGADMSGTGGGATAGTGGTGTGGTGTGGTGTGGMEGGQAGEGGIGEGGALVGAQGGSGVAGGGVAGGGVAGGANGGAGAVTGGTAGMSGSGGADGTTRSCCHGGTQTLSGGVWSACAGAYISAESCNGEDDDCNGQVDELGTITCGVGACATTVPACAGGDVNHCVPSAPAPGPDGCDGIDNDCDGAVDEDCNVCLHVAPTGDDTAAANANGATPFRNVQPALDFAAAHPNVATRVCVAPGNTCGATATFTGPAGADLTMHDGIELLGGYEATAWTRCTNSTTTLAPQTGVGVLFPASITSQTVLDGFAITRSSAATSAGVTVDGAHGALLSNLTITGGPTVMSSYGVNVIDGGNATIVSSSIDAALATQEMIAVRASGGTVAIEDSCATAPDATTGRCTAQCAVAGPKIAVTFQPADTTDLPAQVHAVLLENAPGSRIERSTVCATENGAGGAVLDVAGIGVRGDATGVVLRANTVQAGISANPGVPTKAAIELQDCGGAYRDFPTTSTSSSRRRKQPALWAALWTVSAQRATAIRCSTAMQASGSASGAGSPPCSPMA